MMKAMEIKKATAQYTGGGIYVYIGQMVNGNYFIAATDWEDDLLIVDKDPLVDFDEAFYPEWQDEHKVTEVTGTDALEFYYRVVEWILEHKPEGNYNPMEIEYAMSVTKAENQQKN